MNSLQTSVPGHTWLGSLPQQKFVVAAAAELGRKLSKTMPQQPRKEHAVIWAGQDVLWWKISEEHESKEVQEIRYEGSYPILEKKWTLKKQIKSKQNTTIDILLKPRAENPLEPYKSQFICSNKNQGLSWQLNTSAIVLQTWPLALSLSPL